MTRTRPTIELDGVVYTARPYTNALRTKLAAQIEARETSRNLGTRQGLTASALRDNVEKSTGPIDAQLPGQLADAIEAGNRHRRELEDSAVEIAPLVLVDPDGKAPTKKVIDEHADIEELATTIAIALLEEEPEDAEPSPTKAEPAES